MNLNLLRIPALLIILLSSLAARTTAAQNEPEHTDYTIKENVWALQFRIGPNFTLNEFQGGVISAKYHHRRNRALRFGLTINGSSYDRDRDLQTEIEAFELGDSLLFAQTMEDDRTTDASTFALGIEAQYLFYTRQAGRALLFFGAGPTVRYSKSDTEDVLEGTTSNDGETNTETTITESTSNAWRGGASGVIGVEWFASRRLSLTAEYASSVEYNWADQNMESTSSRTSGVVVRTTDSASLQDQKGWRVGNSVVRFGITVYL